MFVSTGITTHPPVHKLKLAGAALCAVAAAYVRGTMESCRVLAERRTSLAWGFSSLTETTMRVAGAFRHNRGLFSRHDGADSLAAG